MSESNIKKTTQRMNWAYTSVMKYEEFKEENMECKISAHIKGVKIEKENIIC